MKIYLRDRNPVLADAWNKFFKSDDIEVSVGDIFAPGDHMSVDAIVSPANSFGFMDGGIDYVYSLFFGWGMQDNLRAKLWEHHGGELLVGEAVSVDIRVSNPDSPIPYLISAPTMRVPMDVSKTANAYLAFRAALREAKNQGFNSILCPGLGTAIGKVPYSVCALQMWEAYTQMEKPPYYDVLGNAHSNHYIMLNSDTYEASNGF